MFGQLLGGLMFDFVHKKGLQGLLQWFDSFVHVCDSHRNPMRMPSGRD